MEPAAAKHVGAKILGEIEEESLEEVRSHGLFEMKAKPLHQEMCRDAQDWEVAELQISGCLGN